MRNIMLRKDYGLQIKRGWSIGINERASSTYRKTAPYPIKKYGPETSYLLAASEVEAKIK